MIINVPDTLRKILTKRGAFHSEADFQHALAWQLHLEATELQIRLEYPIAGIHVDIFITEPVSARRCAIELKYKTARDEFSIGDELFTLTGHGAHDLGCYDFILDVSRLEKLVSNGMINEGYAIFLTNDTSYKNNAGREDTNAKAFRIHSGRTLEGDLRWGPNTGGTKKNRESPISLAGRYLLEWQNSKRVGDYCPIRHYLIIHVGG